MKKFQNIKGTAAWTYMAWYSSQVDKSHDMFVSKLPVVSSRFCGIKYNSNDTTVLLYSVYMPTSGQDDLYIEVLSLLEFDIKQNITPNCVIFLGIDSNCSLKSSSRRQYMMNLFLSEFSLAPILETDQLTFHHNIGTSESKIDNIYWSSLNKTDMTLCFKELLCVKEEPSNLSSHDVIVGEISLAVEEDDNTSTSKPTTSYDSFIVKKPQWNINDLEKYQHYTFKALDDTFKKLNKSEGIPTLLKYFPKY